MRKGISICIIIFFICMWFLLCYVPQFTEKIKTVTSKEYLLGDEEMYQSNINTTEFDDSFRISLEELKSKIIDIVGENISSFSLIYYEIDSKDSIDINSDYLFKPASTYKIPLNMLLYDMAFRNEVNIDSSIVYDPYDYEIGAGILQGSDMLYSPIALTILSEYSIVYSDNIAANMITRILGYDNLIAYMEQVSGIEIEDDNFIKPKIMLAFLEKLYYNTENNPYYNTLIGYMKNTEFHDRIDAFISNDIVAHKIGDYEDYVNDVGIVYTDKPYIVIFYTEGFSYENIAEISKMIYDYNIQG